MVPPASPQSGWFHGRRFDRMRVFLTPASARSGLVMSCSLPLFPHGARAPSCASCSGPGWISSAAPALVPNGTVSRGPGFSGTRHWGWIPCPEDPPSFHPWLRRWGRNRLWPRRLQIPCVAFLHEFLALLSSDLHFPYSAFLEGAHCYTGSLRACVDFCVDPKSA